MGPTGNASLVPEPRWSPLRWHVWSSAPVCRDSHLPSQTSQIHAGLKRTGVRPSGAPGLCLTMHAFTGRTSVRAWASLSTRLEMWSEPGRGAPLPPALHHSGGTQTENKREYRPAVVVVTGDGVWGDQEGPAGEGTTQPGPAG